MTGDQSIDVTLIVISMAGGLALFLLGLERLTDALKLLAGERMRTVLARLTGNKWAGMATGAGVTAVIQSSSITTVLLVGFISSGVMTLSQSIGVILGANIGSTVTAQIIAFDVARYALALVAIGFGVSFFARRETRKLQGTMVLGLGLVFFGMAVMSDAMEPLQTSDTFIDLMARMENPFLAIAVATVFTGLIQSSAATAGIVIVLAGQGLVTLEAGIALVLGANIGTSITAVLAAVGKPRDAMRAAAAHTLFNVVGAVAWVGLIGALASMVESIGGGVARQIANAHTIFNVVNAFVFIWFTGWLARLAEAIVPNRSDPKEAIVRLRYLDNDLIETPALALDRVRLEVLRMTGRVHTMLDDVLPAVLHGPGTRLREIEAIDDEVDALHAQIVKFLGRVSQQPMGERLTNELIGMMEATNAVEAIGDLIETNLVSIGISRIEQNITVSHETEERLSAIHAAILESYDTAVRAFADRDLEAAALVKVQRRDIDRLEQGILLHQAERLVADEPHRARTYRLEIDLVFALKRVQYFSRRIARTVIPIESRASEG
jgi:phosphate:Na+ symporter